TRTCVACVTDGAPSCRDPDRPACQRSGPLHGACTECTATNAVLCGGVKPVCVSDLGICGCAGPSDDRSCGASDSGLICRGAGGNGCPTEQVCSSTTAQIGRCDAAPPPDGGADAGRDGSSADARPDGTATDAKEAGAADSATDGVDAGLADSGTPGDASA